MSTEGAEATSVAGVLVGRSSLHERIARLPVGTMVVVLAPAGYGKSVLAHDWEAVTGTPTVCLAVAEIPEVDLARTLVSALSQLASAGIAEPTRDADPHAEAVNPPAAPDAAHRTLTDALTDALTDLQFAGATLVLDSADRLETPIERELLRLLAATPREGLTVVATGRSMPMGLAGAHSSRLLVVLDRDDLALTRLDVATAYRDRLTSTDVDEVLRLSGGGGPSPCLTPWRRSTPSPVRRPRSGGGSRHTSPKRSTTSSSRVCRSSSSTWQCSVGRTPSSWTASDSPATGRRSSRRSLSRPSHW
ncbi:MAG TPA: hypothetical protein PLL54_11310 [Dermatophilaceae bacterium]|nr:hypothetical protein [Dermatophilaceae bacterium]